MMKKTLTPILALTASALLVGCNDSGGAGDTGRELKIELTNPVQGLSYDSMMSEAAAQFSATYINHDTGEKVDVTDEVDWDTSNAATYISSTGSMTVDGEPSETVVSARYLDTYASNNLDVAIINPDSAATFKVQPGVFQISQGGSIQYLSSLEFQYQGQSMSQDVTAASTWSDTPLNDGPNTLTVCNSESQIEECVDKPNGFVMADTQDSDSEFTINATYGNSAMNSPEASSEQLLVSSTPKVDSLDISLTTADTELYIGQILSATATATIDEDKQDVTDKVLWHSANPNIASVSHSGLIQAHSDGSTTIEARISDDPQGYDSITITVLDSEIVSIEVAGPTSMTMPTDMLSNETYTVMATYEDGNQSQLSRGITYSSSNYHIAKAVSVDEGAGFKIDSGDVGTVSITAHYDDQFDSNAINTTVEPLTLTKLQISDLNTQLIVGELTPFTANAVYNDGYKTQEIPANSLIVKFDGIDHSTYVGYVGADTNHWLAGKDATGENYVEVSFSYTDDKLNEVATDDISVSVIEASLSELQLSFQSIVVGEVSSLPTSLPSNNDNIIPVTWTLPEHSQATLTNNHGLVAHSLTPISLTAETMTGETHSFELYPTQSPIVDLSVEFNDELDTLTAIAHHADGSTSNASDKVSWHSESRSVLAIDINGNALAYQNGQSSVHASLDTITSPALVLSVAEHSISQF